MMFAFSGEGGLSSHYEIFSFLGRQEDKRGRLIAAGCRQPFARDTERMLFPPRRIALVDSTASSLGNCR